MDLDSLNLDSAFQVNPDTDPDPDPGLRSFADYQQMEAVLRIHDILGWIRIRIRIRGPMPLTNGSESGSCYFRH